MKTISTLALAAMTALLIGCGGGDSGGGGTPSSSSSSSSIPSGVTQSGEINSTVDGVSKTWYTTRTDNHSLAANSAAVLRINNAITIIIGARPTVGTARSEQDGLGFSFVFTNGQVTTGTISDTLMISYQVDEQYYVSTEHYNVELTEASDDGFNIHLKGTITDVPIAVPGTTSTKKISIVFDVTASDSVNDHSSSASSSSNNSDSSSSTSSSSSSSSVSSTSSSSAAGNVSALTVNTPDDVKGYQFISREGIHAITMSVQFECDGSFIQKQYTSGPTLTLTGNNVQVIDKSYSHELKWSGIAGDGDTGTNNISINDSNQIVVGESCFSEKNCANNWHVETITQVDTCN